MTDDETLPNDIARCNGERIDGDWREGCEGCLRRTAPRIGRINMIAPPPITDGECPHLIEPRMKSLQ